MKYVAILWLAVSLSAFSNDLNTVEERVQLMQQLFPNIRLLDQTGLMVKVELQVIYTEGETLLQVGLYNPTNIPIILVRDRKHDGLLKGMWLEYQTKAGEWIRLESVLQKPEGDKWGLSPSSMIIIHPQYTVSFKLNLNKLKLPKDVEIDEYALRCKMGSYAWGDEGPMGSFILSPDPKEKFEFKVERRDTFIYGKIQDSVSNEVKVKSWKPMDTHEKKTATPTP